MKVYLNNREITVFKGATVGEIVMVYSKHSYHRLKSGYFSVYDRYGYLTEPDGPSREGQQFFLKVTRKERMVSRIL